MTDGVNRRAVLGAGVALGAAAMAPALAAAETRPDAGTRVVLVDHALPQAGRFAAEARRLGMTVAVTDGDLTSLWMDELETRWRREPSVLGGVTRPGAVAFLQLMAHRNRMRLSLRIDHEPAFGGVLRHRGVLPSALADGAPARLESDWVRGAARLIADCPRSAPEARMDLTARARSAAGDAGGEAVVSWLITPVSSARPGAWRAA